MKELSLMDEAYATIDGVTVIAHPDGGGTRVEFFMLGPHPAPLYSVVTVYHHTVPNKRAYRTRINWIDLGRVDIASAQLMRTALTQALSLAKLLDESDEEKRQIAVSTTLALYPNTPKKQ